MKVKRINKRGGTSCLQLKDEYEGYKFLAEIMDDGSGFFEVKYKGKQVYCQESGHLDDWLEKVENKYYELSIVSDFLQDAMFEKRHGLEANHK